MKRNKGEWSELYVLLNLLIEGELAISGSGYGEATRYQVAGIDRSIAAGKVHYRIVDDCVHVAVSWSEERKALSRYDVANWRDRVWRAIQKGGGGSRAFAIPGIDTCLQSMYMQDGVGQNSLTKNDIDIAVRDTVLDEVRVYTFSIKSFVGADPTLFNASIDSTRIRYFLNPQPTDKAIEAINAITTSTKLVDRMRAIFDGGYKPIAVDFIGDTFESNLTTIDCCLPGIVTRLLWTSFFVRGRAVSEIVEGAGGMQNAAVNIPFKVKNLLSECALGMTADVEWVGALTVTGGFIFVKKDGTMFAYRSETRQEFWDFLYGVTRLDTPSMSKMAIGKLAKNGKGQVYIDLSLQIRFKSMSVIQGMIAH